MSIASVIYSYLLQALSRLLFSIFDTKHPWIRSFKNFSIFIIINWIIVILIPLPALITKDIYFRPTFLCWVPKEKFLHAMYTLFCYYLIPTIFIIVIYINIYYRVKYCQKTKLESLKKIQQNRNLEILRNICIFIGIYSFGGIPTLIHITTRIDTFYSIGIVFLSLTVTIERICTILLDREIRNIIKNYFCQIKPTTTPIISRENGLTYSQMSQRQIRDYLNDNVELIQQV